MKRRALFLLMIFAGIVMVFGNGQQSTKSAPEGIVWAGWSVQDDAPWMIDNWNQQHPDKKITWVGWPWNDVSTQMLIRSQGNERIDLGQTDISTIATLTGSDILVNWNDVLGSAYLNDNFEAAALSMGNFGGKQLGLPWVVASIGMVFNPEILAKAGFNEPPVTVPEFERCLEAIAKLPGDIIPYGVCTKESVAAYDFIPWLWTFGGRIYDQNKNVILNNPQGVQTFAWYKSLVDRNLIRLNINRDDSRQLFAQGRMAFYDDAVMANGIAIANGVPKERIPQVIRPMVRPVLKAGDTPRSMLWGHMLVIFNKSPVKNDVVELTKYILNKDVALRYYKEAGMLPVLKSVLDSPEIQNDVWAKNWSKITATGELGEFDLNPQVNQLNTIIEEELQACLVGTKTPQQAANDAASRISNVR